MLHATRQGTGPAVLLLHAGVADSRMWRRQIDDLSIDHTVVAPDLRGFGESALPAESYSDAGDLIDLLDALGIDRVDLIGASHGGRVALQFTALAPERVRRSLLLDPAPVTDEVARTPDLLAFGAREDALLEAGDLLGATELNVSTWLGPEADEDAWAVVRDGQLKAFRVQLAAGDDVGPDDVAVDLTAIRTPTTVVSGAHDLDYFRAVAEHLVDTIPHTKEIRLPWAGHLPSMERPDEGTALIRAVLDRT